MEEPCPPTRTMQHANRPRSESWGPCHDDANPRSRFLAKLKQRQQDDLTGSPSAMTLAAPTSDTPASTKLRKRPPLPAEMMQPELLTPHHAASSPCTTTTTTTTTAHHYNHTAAPSVSKKKRSPGIRSIGRFFRAFGKHQQHHAESPRMLQEPSETSDQPTASAADQDTENDDDDDDDDADDDNDAPRPAVVQKYSALNDMQPNKRPTPPRLRRSVSLDERSTITNAAVSITDDHQPPADDSQIAVDRLSKRLSGGHFGSAGGLIASTLSHHHQQGDYHDDDEDDGDEEDTETIESESIALATPPSHSLADYPSSKADSGKADHHHHPATTTAADDGDSKNHEDDEAAEAARRIWEQDATVYDDFEHVAEWIGNGKPFSTSILKHYFAFFDFTNMRVDDAFRLLCSRLHLKAEAQQIDRVLEEFARRFWDCNPFSIYGNPDVVHAIVYSLLLLNTDLHVAQGDHKKMSRSAFVRNTMNAVSVQCQQQLGDAISIQEEHRMSNVTLHSVESHDLKRSPSCKSAASSSNGSNSGPYPFDVPPMTPMTLMFGSKAWQAEIEVSLREMYSSIRSGQILDPSLAKQETSAQHSGIRHTRRRSLQMSSGGRVGAFKRSVGTIMLKAGRDSMVLTEEPDSDAARSRSTAAPLQRRRSASVKSSISHGSHLTSSATTYQSVAPLLHHSELPSSYTCAAPYYKEGKIVRKHLLERAGQKARHREWRECFLVVDRAEIRTYRIDSSAAAAMSAAASTNDLPQQRKSMAPSRKSMIIARHPSTELLAQHAVLGGGDWLANAEPIDTIDLKHTLANTLPSGYSRQRPHAFALQQPNGGVYIFQAGSADQVMEWVSTCNYWAARESKEPLTGGVSSMEYGWGACLDVMDDPSVTAYPPVSTIHEWIPPTPPTVSSSLEEKTQLATLHRHVQQLNQDLDRHRDLKPKILQRFATCMRSQAASRALTNWENKSQYLLHETIKYQNYCDAIERSLALQDEALHQNKQN